jgi:hypothetical protein
MDEFRLGFRHGYALILLGFGVDIWAGIELAFLVSRSSTQARW